MTDSSVLARPEAWAFASSAGSVRRANLWRRLRVMVVTILAAAGLALIALPFALSVVGIRQVQLDGPSMTPTYLSGDLLLERAPAATDLKVGQVVTVRERNGAVNTHRIVEIDSHGLQLRGDANEANDPATIPATAVIGVPVWHAGGHLATVTGFLLSPAGAAVGLALVILAAFIPRPSVPGKRRAATKRPAAQPHTPVCNKGD